MTDDDIRKEIEENQRRAREESDVGLEEDVLREEEREERGTILDDLGEALFGDKDDSREQEVEYDDTTKRPPSR